MSALLQDLRFALRTMRRAPGFTSAVVLTIGIGVGATTGIFAVVNGVLLRPLPFDGSSRVVRLCETHPSVGNWCGASPSNVADWARMSRALESAGVARTEPVIASKGGEHVGVGGGIASPGFFEVLRIRPLLGRVFEERDMARGANHVAILSHTFWLERLGGDPLVVGGSMVLDNQPFTVIGVLPVDAYLPEPSLAAVDVWKPLTASVDDVDNRSWRGFTAIARLAGGVSAGQLQAELEGLRAELARTYPDANRGWGLTIPGLHETVVGSVSRTLWIFLGVAAFVLLIACANVASLLLVRATRRSTEFAVRASLGAGGRRLGQQVVTESLLLALAGGALGVLLAEWATSSFVALAPATIPRLNEVAIDARVALFALGLSAATALLFGLAPARQASTARIADTLKGTRGSVRRDVRLRSLLVIGQVALALVLLAGAGLLTRSFIRLLQWEPGFDRTGVVTSWMLPPADVRDAVAVMERVRDDVAGIPGVRQVALASAGPLFGGIETGALTIEGRPPFAAEPPAVHWFDISPEYFETLGIAVVRGRRFTADDRSGAPNVAIVNQSFAGRFFAGSDPIGRHVSVNEHPSTIVGVVADVMPFEPDRAPPPQIYWPIRQFRRGAAYLVLRTDTEAAGLERAVRARASAVAAGVQVSPFVTLDQRLARNLVSPRFTALLVGTFAAAATLLAAIGIYGVIAYAVASRTREIGVRVALGATPGRLMAAVVGRGMVLASAGIGAGLAGALVIGRVLGTLLYGLSPRDPLTLTAAVMFFALLALAACWVPARRASRMSPVSALRAE